VSKRRHPNKEIDAAIAYAAAKNWTVLEATGHAWGIMRCPFNDRTCRDGIFCQTSIWSTPRSPESHARNIRKAVDNCKGRK
jgi:hypothetical protein